MRTLKQLAQEALDVQDASNILGVTLGAHNAAVELQEALAAAQEPCSTDDIAHHPITRLWASKIGHLTRIGEGNPVLIDAAYQAAKTLANGES